MRGMSPRQIQCELSFLVHIPTLASSGACSPNSGLLLALPVRIVRPEPSLNQLSFLVRVSIIRGFTSHRFTAVGAAHLSPRASVVQSSNERGSVSGDQLLM
jgi:hypothetical protein